MDNEIIAFRYGCPQTLIKHPVSVRGKGEAVAGIVVAAHRVLVDVGGLDDGGGFRVEPIAREGAGKIVAAEHVGLKAAVAAFFLTGFEGGGIAPQHCDGIRVWDRQTKTGAEHNLLSGREVHSDNGAACFAAEVAVMQACVERGIEIAEAGGEPGF
jgi:hypothetical protein